MKILSRDFTFVEKIIITILSIILVGFVYYFLVQKPVSEGIQTAISDQENAQIELDAINARLSKLESMETEMESNTSSYMLSYNGAKKEMALLNDIFGNTDEYTLKFNDVTREGDQIRRNFYFSFKASNYSTAQSLLKKLINCQYRCLIEDMSMDTDKDGSCTISANAIFFETMVDGNIDAALPEDSAIQEETVEVEEYDY